MAGIGFELRKMLKRDSLLGLLRAQSKQPLELDATTDFVSSLGLESIQVMSFVMEVEEHYDIAIDLDSLSGVRTLRDLAAETDQRLDGLSEAITRAYFSHVPAAQSVGLSTG